MADENENVDHVTANGADDQQMNNSTENSADEDVQMDALSFMDGISDFISRQRYEGVGEGEQFAEPEGSYEEEEEEEEEEYPYEDDSVNYDVSQNGWYVVIVLGHLLRETHAFVGS